jgi:hypothetical protein
MKPIRFAWRCLVGHDFLPATYRYVLGRAQARRYCQRCGGVAITWGRKRVAR